MPLSGSAFAFRGGPGVTVAASRPPVVPRPEPLPQATSPRLARLRSETSAASPTVRAAVVRAFWDETAAVGTPLVEELDEYPGERAVTFVWRDRADGPAGDATRAVLLLANKLTDFNALDQSLLTRIAATDVWYLTYRLRADWRGSYHLAPDDPVSRITEPPKPAGAPGDDAGYLHGLAAHARPDPLNRRTTPHRWDGPALSVAQLPDAPAQPWFAPRTGTSRGRLTGHVVHSEALGVDRPVRVYTPPDHDPAAGPYDVLVLFDGDMWGERLPVAATLDNLIADGRIPPLVAVLVDAVDVRARGRDLACHPPFIGFLTGELLPWVRDTWAITDDPARTTVAGQSLGGLAAAFAARVAPERFGNVISQSGSFWWPNSEQDAEWLTAEFADHPRRPVRFCLQVGLQEWSLLGPTRRLRDALREHGYHVDYTEYNGGHDFVCWRGGLADALTALALPASEA